MKNLKEEKGITLVALIITIIVLLILAVVTISAVNEGSLFVHANNAATQYDKAQKEENAIIGNYLTIVDNYTIKKSEFPKYFPSISDGQLYMLLKISDETHAEAWEVRPSRGEAYKLNMGNGLHLEKYDEENSITLDLGYSETGETVTVEKGDYISYDGDTITTVLKGKTIYLNITGNGEGMTLEEDTNFSWEKYNITTVE